MTLDVAFRTSFLDEEVRALHSEAFGSGGNDTSWLARVHAHSLGWVTARSDGVLVGFVNVAWDGGDHAFLVDTMVASAKRRQGIGRLLVERAVAEARGAGCRYLHVEFNRARPVLLRRVWVPGHLRRSASTVNGLQA